MRTQIRRQNQALSVLGECSLTHIDLCCIVFCSPFPEEKSSQHLGTCGNQERRSPAGLPFISLWPQSHSRLTAGCIHLHATLSTSAGSWTLPAPAASEPLSDVPAGPPWASSWLAGCLNPGPSSSGPSVPIKASNVRTPLDTEHHRKLGEVPIIQRYHLRTGAESLPRMQTMAQT